MVFRWGQGRLPASELQGSKIHRWAYPNEVAGNQAREPSVTVRLRQELHSLIRQGHSSVNSLNGPLVGR